MVIGIEQCVIGIIVAEILIGFDGDVSAGTEFALLDRGGIADVFDQIGFYSAIVIYRSTL